MFWRKWLVRALVFSLLSAFLAAGLLYQRWTSPATVHRQVLGKLRELFPGADVALSSAHLRLFGGIALAELHLVRRDDPARADLAYLPSAVLYHDKEQILDGRLALRKVELPRPRLRVVRTPDGRWNLADLVAPGSSGAILPTVVVHQGTVLLDDQRGCPGLPPLEITDVNLTLVNDPLPVVTIEGSGTCELTGPVHLRGRWVRGSNDLQLSVEAAQIPVGPPLIQRLGYYCPQVGEHARHLEGTVDLRAEVTYQPGRDPCWCHEIHARLAGGTLHHPRLPTPLDHLEAEVHCRGDHLTVERFSGRAGVTRVSLTGTEVRRTADGFDFGCAGRIDHLPVTHDLFARLPENIQHFEAMFRPVGLASLAFELDFQKGGWRRQHCVLRPEAMQATYAGFPYPVAGLAGSLDMDFLAKLTRVDLAGTLSGRPVTAHGTWQRGGAEADVRLDIRGKDVPLDPTLEAALPHPYQNVARAFHLRGRGDFDVAIRHTPGRPTFANRYVVHIAHGSMKWNDFPYPLEEVSGVLDIQPDHWEFHDFRGVRSGGEFRGEGRSYPAAGPGPAEARVAIDIRGTNVRLDADMKNALDPFPGLTRAWATFSPKGSMNFHCKIDQLPRQAQDLDVAVDIHGCTLWPQFFHYTLADVSGQLHYARDRLRLANVTARHRDTVLKIPAGEVRLFPSGGLYADLANLQVDPLYAEQEFLAALPPPMKKAIEGLGLKEPVSLRTRLVVSLGGEPGSLPDIYWDGKVWLLGANFQLGAPLEKVTGCFGCVGRHNGYQLVGVDGNVLLDRATFFNQPFHDVHGKIDVFEESPDVLVVGLKAPLFGGEISGPVRVEMGSTLRYEMDLTASEIQLASFGQHNLKGAADFKGIAGGRLHLAGKGADLSGLEGNGTLDVPHGQLYNLPLLLDLLKFLGLRLPDRTAFEQAHANFTIHGDLVRLNQLELLGNAISLHGQGNMRLDGSDVQLDFIPVWGRIEQLLPPVWQPIPGLIGKNVLKIEMRGKVGNLKFHKKPVPGLFDPLASFGHRLAGTKRPDPPPLPAPGK